MSDPIVFGFPRSTFALPSTYAFGMTEEGKRMYPKYPSFCRWRERMESSSTVRRLRADCRRTLPSSMRGNGRFPIDRNTEGENTFFKEV